MDFYRGLLKPVLFRMDAERAHILIGAALSALQQTPGALAVLKGLYGADSVRMPVRIGGLEFPRPVGLAAGFDKEARWVRVLPSFGFGFLEVGTITLQPQEGNPKPRLFRIPEACALVNSMGFNNCGAQQAARRLAAAYPYQVPVGINLGKNAETALEEADGNYAAAFKILYPHGDFFVLNLSSPNTPGLRVLQRRKWLCRILDRVCPQNASSKPIFLKISPDLEEYELDELLQVAQSYAIGLVIANTTISREGVPERFRRISGGLSGSPLRVRALQWIRRVAERSAGRVPLIGTGGIFSAEDVQRQMESGASLVELYTGWIYRGPSLMREILGRLRLWDGFAKLSTRDKK
ncbi:MAG: quinone-dependent dihydroorotate dehydrogenase [Elusimicrobia bacterium]|nr:quinone-dependent dihydroorotate dehydrogenase [Elusimicrobiota bacterium]